MNQNELMHYGVLGMKWGVRKYQNEDGSLTDAGKRHYGIKGKNIKADNRKMARYKYEYAKKQSEDAFNKELKDVEKNYTKRGIVNDKGVAKRDAAIDKYMKEQANIKDEYLTQWAQNESVGHIVGSAIVKSLGADLVAGVSNAATGGVLQPAIVVANSITNLGIAGEMVSYLVKYAKYK